MDKLADREGSAARALEFTILTAGRTGEALEARWDEIDSENAIWTVPAERMKAGREHRVPLSARAIAVLERVDCRDRTGFVFSRTGGRKPLSIMAMAMVLRRMEESVTVHGFRSSFRDWAAETTNFPNEVCEMALAHTIPGKAEAAYRRGDLFVKRRRLMEDWGRYCDGQVDEPPVPGRVAGISPLDEQERSALLGMLANARCPLCGSGWGEPCRNADDVELGWPESHERRYARLVEDWALATDQDLLTQLAAAQAAVLVPKVAIIKMVLARRSLTPLVWVRYGAGGG